MPKLSAQSISAKVLNPPTRELVLSVDQGTTSSRTILFDLHGRKIFSAQRELTLSYPRDGWVEQDPSSILQDVDELIAEAVKFASASNHKILCAGITNQRETVIAWNKRTGRALSPAIVWQDRRTKKFCEALRAQHDEASFNAKTGLYFDPYFSASKIRWLLDNVESVQNCFRQEDLAVGTIESFLAYNLLEEKPHITDVSNASRTALMNLDTLTWDSELLDLFGIPSAILPTIRDNTGSFGRLKGCEIPLLAMIGDQQSAALGQACLEVGDTKATFGTGCFVMANTGSKFRLSRSRLLSTVAYKDRDDRSYAIEGSLFNAGSAVQWLRDGLGLIASSKEIESLARRALEDSSVVMVPAFTGLGAPSWQPNARASFFGITRDSNQADFALATLEAIAMQTADLLKCMQQDGITISSLKVDGGMCANSLFMQKLADFCRVIVRRPEELECTALGAAILALSYQRKTTLADTSKLWEQKQAWLPQACESYTLRKSSLWSAAKASCLHYAKAAELIADKADSADHVNDP